MDKIPLITDGENMGLVRERLNEAINRANLLGMPVNTFANLPADPEPFQAHFVHSLGYAVHWVQADQAWFNPMAAPVSADDE